jgi:hypothetical protein
VVSGEQELFFFFFEMSADYIVAAIGWRIVVVQLDRVSRLTS